MEKMGDANSKKSETESCSGDFTTSSKTESHNNKEEKSSPKNDHLSEDNNSGDKNRIKSNSNIQQHDEESESDLQSVLNKISESLKTINQETMSPQEQNEDIVQVVDCSKPEHSKIRLIGESDSTREHALEEKMLDSKNISFQQNTEQEDKMKSVDDEANISGAERDQDKVSIEKENEEVNIEKEEEEVSIEKEEDKINSNDINSDISDQNHDNENMEIDENNEKEISENVEMVENPKDILKIVEIVENPNDSSENKEIVEKTEELSEKSIPKENIEENDEDKTEEVMETEDTTKNMEKISKSNDDESNSIINSETLNKTAAAEKEGEAVFDSENCKKITDSDSQDEKSSEKNNAESSETEINSKTDTVPSSSLIDENNDKSEENVLSIVNEKSELLTAEKQMDVIPDDDENDVVAIEEPTTIIDLSDDDDEMTDTKMTSNGEEVEKMDVDAEETVVDKNDKNIMDNEPASEISDNNKNEEKIESPVDKYVFRNKECINYECKQQSKDYYKAPNFAMSFYKITIKPNKAQFICDDCYDLAVDKFEEWCNTIEDHQPLLMLNIPQKNHEFVEILDSSDEEDVNVSKSTFDKGDFPANTVELLQNELDNIISDVFGRVNIQNQLTWSKTVLQHRLLKLQEDSDYITDTLGKLQKNADNMNNSLYQCPKIEMKVLAPLDLNSGKTYILGATTDSSQYTIPPLGEIIRPKIELNGIYYGAKNKVMASWLPCKVIEFVDAPLNQYVKNLQYYKIKFIKIKIPTLKCVPAKHMAYNESPKVQLAIGTRVIALFDASTLSKGKDRSSEIKSAFYPGIIAEALQTYNNFRYLIFFDDGYTQYVHHRDVRLICEASVNVWEDIHPGSREFIQNYLINYKKNRPMVQVKKGQSMITELNGKWIYAKVIDVDASLINMLFEGQKNHTEWIYRGSTRLGPLFKATQATNIPAVTRLPRRSEPYVRYMQDDDNALRRETATKSTATTHQEEPPTPPVRAVAKKSTSRQETPTPPSNSAPVKHLNNSTIFVDDEEPKGKLVYYSAKIDSNPPPKSYEPHDCSPACITRKITIGHNYGVLSKPLLNGWERAIYKLKGKKSAVIYTAPCGRRVRTMEEAHSYLRKTKNALNVENFVFDPECGCLTEYQVQRCIVNKADITEGSEKMPIQCVNYYDHTMPPECVYSAVRLPTEGVNINTDLDFLVGCDCEDDCSDKSKCSCWQLTLEGAKYGNAHTQINNVGYHFKRLPEPVPTGIYECNSRCKCSKQCINRVVQHPLETKLQVFKTSNRGWGLRCINDVPKGSFICIYAGDLLTEQKANEGGANSGDEYFAELDYIEVAERLKEGYESDVQEDIESDDEDEQYIPENESDEEFQPSKSSRNVATRNQAAKKIDSRAATEDEQDEQERQAINFEPSASLANADEENSPTKYQSMRKYFGKNEFCYIMDAKNIGNVGRYFNHSCSPNLFVQNVFVDTHDLRFPWVAFFALSQIRAGTELTWNYNYEVGVVPGKVLYCECGAPNCRGRLL